MTRSTCGGILLTGGSSRRLGVDKATLRWRGETLAARAARALAEVCDAAVEVGSGVSGLPSVREEPVGSGPLAALVAGADALGCTPVLLFACDLPWVDAALLGVLVAHPGSGSVVPVVGGRPQTVCARYDWSAVDRARQALDRGERALQVLLAGGDVALIGEEVWGAVGGPEVFADVDTPADVERLGLEPPG